MREHASDGFGMVQTPLMRAKTTMMAAKYAYASRRPHWLGLFAQAVERIQACPEEYQRDLMSELHRFFAVSQV